MKKVNKGMVDPVVNENTLKQTKDKPSRELMGYIRAALAYLDRYGGPRARIQRTLERRARRKGLEDEAARQIISAAMHELDQLNIMDDATFAAGKAAALRRRGASKRQALAKLAMSGIEPQLAAEALDELDSRSEDDAERAAAIRYAQRRRLGPWRLDQQTRGERRERDIAALTRTGFSVGLSIAVIDGIED
ncbi:MAG: RecX family transcriptional regulator [Rhodospirillales bacterium]